MMRLVVPAFLLVSGAASAQTLTMDGDCPGAVTISVDGLTAGGTAAFIVGGAGEGDDVIGAGPCAGTVTGLAGLRLMTRVTADDAGMITFSPDVPDAACDTPVQVLDVTTCALSNVEDAAAPVARPCSEVALDWCLAKGWFLADGGEAEGGNIVCTIDGRSTGHNCDTCDTYNIIVWEDGSQERHCPDVYSTVAGEVYSAHTPCACGDNLDFCDTWDMEGCIPD